MPEDPSTQRQVPTGFIMNAPKPPADFCACQEDVAVSDPNG